MERMVTIGFSSAIEVRINSEMTEPIYRQILP